MSFLSRWWYRPVPRRRAILVLVLMAIAAFLFILQAVEYDSTLFAIVAWFCGILLVADGARIIAGLAADRYPRE
jgi:hypothetical protein